MAKRRVLLAVESLHAGKGGICRLARLTAKVLADMMQMKQCIAQGIVLNDLEAPRGPFEPIVTARGSRARFVWKVQKAALRHSHMIYDFLGMARAHSGIPSLLCPFLTWICGIEVWENAPRTRICCARRASSLVAISSYTRERANAIHGGFSHVPVCWLGTETNDLPHRNWAADQPPIVLILGRMDHEGYKGHRELIDCWPSVTAAIPDAQLLMVGGGPALEKFKDYARQSSAAPQIRITNFVSEKELDSIWKRAAVFAMPSRGEGFGLVYIEAMRHGLPVIASIHDAAPEVNVEGVTGYNVDLDRPAELQERIVYLLKNRDQAMALGQKGQEQWRTQFSYSAFRSRFMPILEQFLQL